MHLPGVSHTEKAADKMSFIAAWPKEFGSYSTYLQSFCREKQYGYSFVDNLFQKPNSNDVFHCKTDSSKKGDIQCPFLTNLSIRVPRYYFGEAVVAIILD